MNRDVHSRAAVTDRPMVFRLGRLEVRPATLEVIAPDGRRETLEPRVMRVLAVLAERDGELVSRDTLNELCWGGRVVGDDALQRCISRLRKIGRAHGAFDIENVRGVGLRLVESQGSTRSGVVRRRWALPAVAALVLALVGFVGWRTLQRPHVTPEPKVAVGTFGVQDPAGRELAGRLADDLRGVLVDNLAGARVEGQTGSARGDLTLGGMISRDGGTLKVRANLTDRSGALLWTREYAQSIANQNRLRDQVVVGATESVVHALNILRQPVKLDPETIALYVTSLELSSTGDPTRLGVSERQQDEVLARAPTLGLLRGDYAFRLMWQMDAAAPQERERLKLRAHQEAERAIRDSPHAGNAYDALYWLSRSYEAPGDLVAAENVLLKGLAGAPDTARIAMRECRFLMEVGRDHAALPYCARALALRPMGAPFAEPYATALYRGGNRDDARQAIERFARYHPEHPYVRSARFSMRLNDEDFDGALQLLRSPDTRPYAFNDKVVPAVELLIAARRLGTAQAADRAIAAMRTAIRNDGMDPALLMVGATRLGRLDDAFWALAQVKPDLGNIFPNVYLPEMAPLRKDPRFWEEANRGGYLRYWRTRGIWPDFCEGAGREMDCSAAAARAGV